MALFGHPVFRPRIRIEDAQPGCDFVTVNFETRLKARQVEKDGLVEAKAILSGAKFDESP